MIYRDGILYKVVEKENKLLDIQYMWNVIQSDAIYELYKSATKTSILDITKKVFNEGYILSDKTAKGLESLAKQYEFEDLIAWFKRYWEDMDNIAISGGLAREARNRPLVEHDIMKEIAAFKEEIELTEDGPAMKTARISYLEEESTNLSSQVRAMDNKLQSMDDHDIEGWIIDLAKKEWDFEKLAGKLRSHRITIAHLGGVYDEKKVVVTDEMIALAKKVPFNKILKLEDIGGKMRCSCPFHKEKTPSFYIYPDTNRGHCHGCGKNVDTIQYLVEIKKIQFNQAVLTLLSY